MKTLEKDILLICKGWYNNEKYTDILDAFNGYYHREYGCEEIIMDKSFALNLFLKPTVTEMNRFDCNIINALFMPSFNEAYNTHTNDFTNIMYDRCIIALAHMRTSGMIDLSDYEDMFSRFRDREESQSTEGII